MGVFRRLGVLMLGVVNCAAALGSPVVQFTDGRAMRVESVEYSSQTAVLTLEGGGVIAIPANRIAKWQDVPDPREVVVEDTVRVQSETWRVAAGGFAKLIEGAARRHRLEPALLTAMAQVESAFNPEAISPKGAQGLLQLMPATAERFGVDDVYDVAQNVEGGARYLRWLLERYDGATDLALAGYNAGEAAVDRHQGIPPYAETKNYVARVLEQADLFLGGARLGAAYRP
jgi:soluble lytic murein transglycosylase-like protein